VWVEWAACHLVFVHSAYTDAFVQVAFQR
jgi:hypothetical protein